jgi:hypothetical protein
VVEAAVAAASMPTADTTETLQSSGEMQATKSL